MNHPVTPKGRKRPNLSAIQRLQLRRLRSQTKREQIDWTTVHERLEATHKSTEVRTDNDAILHERALQLSQPMQDLVASSPSTPLLVLRRGNCRIALKINWVREIIPLEMVTFIPGVPPFTVGIVNARGKILTLVDLEIFLRHKGISPVPTPPAQRQSIILVNLNDFEFGIICDEFPVIGQQFLADFKPLEHLSLDYCSDYLSGIDSTGVLLVNLELVTAAPDFLVDQE